MNGRHNLVLLAALLLLSYERTVAFDNRHAGFLLGGGLGGAPVAQCIDSSGRAKNCGGVAFTFAIGAAPTERDLILLQLERVVADVGRAFAGLVYSRMVGAPPHRYFWSLGAGAMFCSGPSVPYQAPAFSFDIDWPDVGFAATVGGGRELVAHLLLYGRLTIGSLRHKDVGASSNHAQVTIGVLFLAY